MALALPVAVALASPDPPKAAPAVGGRLELQVTPDRQFAIYAPAGWQVHSEAPAPQQRRVVVREPAGQALAQVHLRPWASGERDAVAAAAGALQQQALPGLRLLAARAAADRRRSLIDYEFVAADRTTMRARQYVLADGGEVRVYAYQAPAARFAALQPTLVSVLTNVTPLDAQRFPVPAARGGTAPLRYELQPRRLPDGTASLRLPAAWQLAGEQGRVLGASRDGSTGFAFSTASYWGPSSLPHFDASRVPGATHLPYTTPLAGLQALMHQVGSRDLVVLERTAEPARAAQASAALRRRVEIERAWLEYTSAQGVRCKGYFEMLAFTPLPSGQWGILYFAVWAPRAEFDRHAPGLAEIAASYRVDERWAADYVARGLENLRRQMARTSQMMADSARAAREALTAAFEERARSSDYIDYRRTQVIRGEQEWVSAAEGGALYRSDHWGLSREGQTVVEGQPYNVYNFDGRNPRTGEQMTPVDASREVYERVHGRR